MKKKKKEKEKKMMILCETKCRQAEQPCPSFHKPNETLKKKCERRGDEGGMLVNAHGDGLRVGSSVI